MTFDVLIIGLGQIGMGYDLNLDPKRYVYSHASAFSQHKGFNIVGGVDLDNRAGKAFEKKYGCAFYDNVQEALQKHNPDVIVISVSTQFHKQVLQDIVKYSKPKVILCEKPLSYNIEEAYEMQQLCKANSIKLFVNYIRDSDPNSIEIKTKIDSGEYAGSLKGVVWYSKGLIHNGSHFIDLLKHWFGPIQSSFIIDNGQKLSQGDVEADFKLNFKDVSMIFTATREEFFSHYTIELISPNGRLRYDRGGKLVIWQDRSSNAQGNQAKVLLNNETVIKSNLSKYQMNVVNQLNMVIKGQDSYLCTGEQALELSKDIFSIIKKIKYV